MAAGATPRLKELILYVAAKMASDHHAGAGRIKLAKLLWRIDFTAFWKLGKPITEAHYWADQLGPAPQEELMATRDLQTRGRFEWEQDWDRRWNPVVLDPARMDAFSEEEMTIIDRVIDEFRSASGKQMVDEAHEFPGWVHAWRDGKGARTPIPYESVFWGRRGELSEAEERHAAELAVEFRHFLAS